MGPALSVMIKLYLVWITEFGSLQFSHPIQKYASEMEELQNEE